MDNSHPRVSNLSTTILDLLESSQDLWHGLLLFFPLLQRRNKKEEDEQWFQISFCSCSCSWRKKQFFIRVMAFNYYLSCLLLLLLGMLTFRVSRCSFSCTKVFPSSITVPCNARNKCASCTASCRWWWHGKWGVFDRVTLKEALFCHLAMNFLEVG